MPMVAFLAGLFIGSFLNVCICRIPCGESVVFPPSRCPRCGKRLGPGELIPLFSYFWQRGRCRGCGEAVSGRYALVELLTGVVFAVLFLRFGRPWFAAHAVFFAILLVIFFIDLDHQIIPNRLVAVLLALALFYRTVSPEAAMKEGLAGAALGGVFFFLLAVVSRGGMGGGDVKLVTALGLWFGWAKLLPLLFFAFLGGGLAGMFLLMTGKKGRKDGIAFGPFLVLAAFVVAVWGEIIIAWYLKLNGI